MFLFIIREFATNELQLCDIFNIFTWPYTQKNNNKWFHGRELLLICWYDMRYKMIWDVDARMENYKVSFIEFTFYIEGLFHWLKKNV